MAPHDLAFNAEGRPRQHRSQSQSSKEAVMEEVFPVLSGIVVGLVLGFIPQRIRMLALGALSVAFGILASWISGELAVSWIYLLIDIAQVLGAALLTSVLVTRVRSRSWRLP